MPENKPPYDPCATECQFAKDVAMPEHSCGGECQYELKAKREKAVKIVAQWLVELWITQPDWLAKMPDHAAVDSLIERIAKNG